MMILALDTSTYTGSVALVSDTQVIGMLSVNIDMTHSEGLMPAIDALLERTSVSLDQVTAIACTVGPGSFTGLRVGIATAQGLAMARGIPTLAVSALDAFASFASHASHPVRPIIPARKNWVYTRLYQWIEGQMQPQGDEQYIPIDDCIALIQQPTLVYGPALPVYQEYMSPILGDCLVPTTLLWNQPRADVVAMLAMPDIVNGNTIHPAQLTPQYLAPSQAEINFKRP